MTLHLLPNRQTTKRPKQLQRNLRQLRIVTANSLFRQRECDLQIDKLAFPLRPPAKSIARRPNTTSLRPPHTITKYMNGHGYTTHTCAHYARVYCIVLCLCDVDVSIPSLPSSPPSTSFVVCLFLKKRRRLRFQTSKHFSIRNHFGSIFVVRPIKMRLQLSTAKH